jgi:hypothetical protein
MVKENILRKRYVLYSPKMGVFLGTCLGLGFWSKLDPVGQDAAVTFESPEKAKEAASSWDSPIECRPVPIWTKQKDSYATISDCEFSGLPPWSPKDD